MAREPSALLSFFPAELWNVTTPELVALPMLALAEPDTIPLPAVAETSAVLSSALVCCICMLAADSRAVVAT